MQRKKEGRTAYLFLLPTLLIFVGLTAVPVIISLLLSFTEWNFLSGFEGLKFVGMDNFTELFEDNVR